MPPLSGGEKIALTSHEVSEADHEALEKVGFTREETWDVAAFFAMSNRLTNMASICTDDEFYLLGRTPKESSYVAKLLERASELVLASK